MKGSLLGKTERTRKGFSLYWNKRERLVKKEEYFMATSSIKKDFVIKDDKAFDVLLKVMQQKKKTEHSVDYCEEGKRTLKKYFSR